MNYACFYFFCVQKIYLKQCIYTYTLSICLFTYLFLVCFQATESEAGDMDLSGLPETAVDSEDDDDEEDIERASDPLMSRDIVRDCLEKDPIDRTDDDIGKSG